MELYTHESKAVSRYDRPRASARTRRRAKAFLGLREWNQPTMVGMARQADQAIMLTRHRWS